MKQIGLMGGGFLHAYSSTLWKKPTHFEWAKNQIKDVTCFVDDAILLNIDKHLHIKKIGWLAESSGIIPHTIDAVSKNYKEISESYEFVFTNDARIMSLADNFVFLPPTGYWVENTGIYPKTKLCSMICSNKNMCEGHAYRLQWAKRLHNQLDFYGRGFNEFNKKEEAIKDYMFSVTMENAKYNSYWSEKILDCFLCGTVPIYHGASNIGDFFVEEGIITLGDNFDVSQLSPDLYLSKEDAIIENYHRALKYNCSEDIMWEQYLFKLW
jgi:hypothetical protein